MGSSMTAEFTLLFCLRFLCAFLVFGLFAVGINSIDPGDIMAAILEDAGCSGITMVPENETLAALGL